MFKEEVPEIQRPKFEKPPSSDKSELSYMNEGELLALRDEINQALRNLGSEEADVPDLGSMDLHRELTSQYQTLKKFQKDILYVEDIEPNKVASVMNATTSTLAQLIKLQEGLEREGMFKKMETCLIKAVGMLPDEAKKKFFDEYERLAKSEGLE